MTAQGHGSKHCQVSIEPFEASTLTPLVGEMGGGERIGGASYSVFTLCHSLSSVYLVGTELLSAIRGTSFLLSPPDPPYIHCLATERMHCAI